MAYNGYDGGQGNRYGDGYGGYNQHQDANGYGQQSQSEYGHGEEHNQYHGGYRQQDGYHEQHSAAEPHFEDGPGPELVHGYPDNGYSQEPNVLTMNRSWSGNDGHHQSTEEHSRSDQQHVSPRHGGNHGPKYSAHNAVHGSNGGGQVGQQRRKGAEPLIDYANVAKYTEQNHGRNEPMSPRTLSQDTAFPAFPLPKQGNKKHEDNEHRNRRHNDGPSLRSIDTARSRADIGHTPSYDQGPKSAGPTSSGWKDFHFGTENRSQTMPVEDDNGPSFDLPHRGPRQHRRSDEGPTKPMRFSFEDTISPLSVQHETPLSPLSPEGPPPPRSDSQGATLRLDAEGRHPQHPSHRRHGRGSDGKNDHYDHGEHGPQRYATNRPVQNGYDDRTEPYPDPTGWMQEEEDMPNFNATAPSRPNEELHMGNNPPTPRGRGPMQAPAHNFEPRSHSQPNFRDGPRAPPPGYGPPPGDTRRGPGGYGGPPPNDQGGRPRPPQGYQRGQYQPPPQNRPGQSLPNRPGPPPGQYQQRPRPGPGPGPGPGPARGPPPNGGPGYGSKPYSPAPGQSGPRGPPPNNRPVNPDALPEHPVPVRPGLMQNHAMSPVPGQQSPASYGPPGPLPRAQTMPPPMSQPNIAPPPPQPQQMPVTQDELARLRQQVNSNPSDQRTQILLAEKLIEASSTLIGSKQYVDQKTRNKARQRFLEEAHRLLKRLIGYGSTDAMFCMADCHGKGLFTPGPDPKEAFNLYQQAAKANHPQAAYRLAVCCELGQDEGGGTRRDPLKAMQWYRRAATLGDIPATYKMGMILLKGLLGQPKNPREAIQWLQRAAERADADNPHALHELALLYQTGSPADGVPCDEGYARELFQQAAQLGYKFAQYQMGAAFEYGSLGFPIDPRQSIAWYSKAAAQEEHQSELALSGWYLTGSDGVIQQSDTEAYLWARKAAQAGLSKAEYAMGYFNEVGIGAPADLEAAKRWYWRAASQNYPKARERLEDLRKGGARMQKSTVTHHDVRGNGDCRMM